MTLDEYIDEYGNANCEGCKYYLQWTEWHPYGMTMAPEDLWECDAADDDVCQGMQQLED